LMKEQKDTIKAMTSRLVPVSGGNLPAVTEDAEDGDEPSAAALGKPKVEEEDDKPAPRRGRPPGTTRKATPPDEEETRAQAAKDVTPKPKPKNVDPDEDAEVPQGMRAKKPDPDDEDDQPKKPNGAAAAAKAANDPPSATPGKGNIKDLLKDWDD
jgi:hypothetical protein